MSNKNDNDKNDIKTINIDDVNLRNLGTGYVESYQEDNLSDDKNPFVAQFLKITKEPKHFLQVLREAIDAQIKIIEEEKKAAASKVTNQQSNVITEHYNAPMPVNNNESDKSQNSINSEEYSVEEL